MTGKTSFVDFNYVLLPYMWYVKNKETTDIKLKIIYRSMERSKRYKIQKWTCLYLYIITNGKINLDIPTLNGWEGKAFDITPKLRKQIAECEEFINEMLDSGIIDLVDGAENPTGIYKNVKDFALHSGKEDLIKHNKEDGSSYTELVYTPDNKEQYTILVLDHIGKLKRETHGGKLLSKKENIDKMSEYLGLMRDRYGISPVVISQFNRGLSDSQRMRNKTVAPEPDDFKDSGNMYEDADVAFALFNPYKLKVDEDLGYRVDKFVTNTGYNRYRSGYVLKNSFGIDDVGIGLKFIGECGYFSELPPASEGDKVQNAIKNL